MLRLPILIFNALSNFSNGEACCNIRQNWKTLKKTKTIGAETTLHKKWTFPLRTFSVNLIKSTGNCGFGHIYWNLRIWSHLLKKCLMKNFVSYALQRFLVSYGYFWFFVDFLLNLIFSTYLRKHCQSICHSSLFSIIPTGIYLLKVNNKRTETICENFS